MHRCIVRWKKTKWLSCIFSLTLVIFYGTIFAALRWRPDGVAWMVGLYITAAYWFTASTSFANPAVTIARTLSDTFAGIFPAHAPAFIAAQVVGAVAATLVFGWLLRPAAAPAAEPAAGD